MTSPHVRIVHLDAATLAALAEGDLAAANATSPVPLTEVFVCDEWRGTWRMRAQQVVDDPPSQGWVTGVIWDDERGLPVGRAGFHGPPDGTGMVEVGYAVDPALRRRGYGRAALVTMLQRAAADPDVHTVRASISPGNAASLGLVQQHGFVQVGDQWDDEDGLELVYEVPA